MTLIEKELKNAYIGYGITLLPSDYQQVEYIESSGTQYIDTQFTYTQTTGEVKTKMMSKEFGSYYYSQRYTGAYNTNNTRTFMLYNNTPTAYIGIGGNDYSTGFNISINTIYNIDAKIETAGTCVYTLNGQSTTISYSGTIVTGKPYFIFCDNENGSPANYGKDRLYYFKMYEAGSLVRDFIPCYRKADGAIGLYDLVDDIFYANAGSGVFAKGGNVYPEVPSGWDALDISTVTLSKQFSTGYSFQGLYINPDENVALTASFGDPNGTIRGYSYSNKDISTASLTLGNKTSPQAHSVFANSTGTHIYSGKHGIGSYSTGGIYEYSTTGWNVGNMISYKTLFPGSGFQTIWVNKAETYAICFGVAPSESFYVYVYEMSTPGDISSAIEIKAISCTKNLHGLFFNDEMTKCVACEYSASSGTVYQYDRDILNSSSFPSTPTHTLGPVGFTIGYANINDDVTTMYAVRENGYIYQYTLS